MKNIKLAILTLVVGVVANGILQAGPIRIEIITEDIAPTPKERQLMKLEEELHPNIAKAINDIKAAMKSLKESPDDFGGHKAQAEKDLRASYVSLRKALYYRLYEESH